MNKLLIMSNISILKKQNIIEHIHFVGGLKIMLDHDLASLYGVQTKALKQAVRRNLKRFPKDFMFELTIEEYQSLRSQFVTLKRGKHSKYPPFTFTEQGIEISAMDATAAVCRADHKHIYFDA